MRTGLVLALGLIAANYSNPAFATEQTIRLSVPAMNCASCPYLVKHVISDVDGVISAYATLDDRTATVTYDDERTNIEAIVKATASIGYESTLISGGDS